MLYIFTDPRWGKGRRAFSPISEADVVEIRRGNKDTDRDHAKRLKVHLNTVRAIRYGMRQKDG